jgi:hypothetical protein
MNASTNTADARTVAWLQRFFVSSTDGALYDTTRAEWANKPLRPIFLYTFARITNGAQLRATLRAGENTFPGCYPMYMITSDGGALHFACVRDNLRSVLDSIRNKIDDGWRVQAVEVNYESTDLYCDHCGKLIEAAYSE